LHSAPRGREFFLLDAVDYFHHLVVHRNRHSRLAALRADGSVDGIDFRLLALLQVLQHTCLEEGVLADCERDDEKRDGFLYGLRVKSF
jgi:hypothetical protein